MGFFNGLKQQALEMAQEEARKQIEKQFGAQAAAMLPGKSSSGGGKTNKVTAAQYEAHKPADLRKDVRMISGCMDAQTSADVSNVGSFQLPDPCGELTR
jgi:hypothetical protein